MAGIEVELLQEEKSHAVDYKGKSYTVVERYHTINDYTDYEVYALDDPNEANEEIDEEIRHKLIEAVKRFSEA